MRDEISSALAYLMVVSFILTALLAYDYFKPYDSCDSQEHGRCGAVIVVDNISGCHYLKTAFGGITPRMDAKNNQICVGHEK